MPALMRGVGLALFFLIFGHDLIMAAPNDAPIADAPGMNTHGAVAVHGLPPGIPAASHHAPLDHPSNCGIGQETLSRPLSLPALADVSLGDLAHLDAYSLTTFNSQPLPLWQQPHAPPGVFRAFIQVFRV